MSKVMMSAPSPARRTAWECPCPRAPPLMKATLPSRRLILLRSSWNSGRVANGLELVVGGGPAQPVDGPVQVAVGAETHRVFGADRVEDLRPPAMIDALAPRPDG